jgi:murein DD-endopeptidase MepM/ murein hydrolase activator NlpD
MRLMGFRACASFFGINSGDFMLRYPLFFFFFCLALLITAYDASATARQTGTTKASAASIKAAKAKSASVAKKEAGKASETSGVVGSAKKSSKKQQAQVSAKSSKSKAAKSRKYTKDRRDPDSLPAVAENFAETPEAVLTVLSAVPADGDISSFFGVRRLSTKTKRVRMHTGIDIKAARGAPVFAAASGVVCFVGRWSAYGKIVEIDHGNGLVTRYAHLDRHIVEQGAAVDAGEQIGTVGSTGRTTGAHLHFETLVNGSMVDPMMAEIWQKTPERLAAKHDTYVSGLRTTKDTY